MVTMAQRIAELRSERGLSAPALSAALGFPRTAIDKFESGRQTPTQDQQSRMATYFGVTLAYLRGESGDRTETEDWMAGGIPDPEPVPMPRAERPSKPAKPSGEPGRCSAPWSRARSSRTPCTRRCWMFCALRRDRRS